MNDIRVPPRFFQRFPVIQKTRHYHTKSHFPCCAFFCNTYITYNTFPFRTTPSRLFCQYVNAVPRAQEHVTALTGYTVPGNAKKFYCTCANNPFLVNDVMLSVLSVIVVDLNHMFCIGKVERRVQHNELKLDAQCALCTQEFAFFCFVLLKQK